MSVPDSQHSELQPRIVAFGGGTGMVPLLSGLKTYSSDITAIVTVADDGGSSGRLRKEFDDMLPPGDIRNCLVALAQAEPLMGELFQYTFEESDLKGHKFGNLLLAALTRITGDFGKAVQVANKILSVRGQVIPSVVKKVALVAHHEDGTKSTGEAEIGLSRKPIKRLELRPDPGRLSAEAKNAIEHADVLVFGPGSLYTSIIPNLLVGGMVEAIRASRAAKVFVANLMTQPGETDNFTLLDHLQAFSGHAAGLQPDYIIFCNKVLPEKVLGPYYKQGSTQVKMGGKLHGFEGAEVIECNEINMQVPIRHEGSALAATLMKVFRAKTQPGLRAR